MGFNSGFKGLTKKRSLQTQYLISEWKLAGHKKRETKCCEVV